MTDLEDFLLEGMCTCGAVRYRITSKPLFVHCCHCRWCQRETGASFALNATAWKQPWVMLPPGMPAVHAYYDRNDYWPAASLERRRELLARGAAG